ncbi:hypothetical protein NUS56_03980 [Glaesserella parasuis]|nr:hypothetical protein [Glaesserella parasuis]MDE4012700.1 hypothetical protein [Glaesserella parasuis]
MAKFYFQKMIAEKLLNHPACKEWELIAFFKYNCVEIRSIYWSSPLSLVFIQHSKFHFEMSLDCEFEHKIYGKCYDHLLNEDCYIRKTEKGYYCEFDVENKHYIDMEALLMEHQINIAINFLEKYGFCLRLQYWVKDGMHYAFLENENTEFKNEKLRKSGWEQCYGCACYTDDELKSFIYQDMLESKEITISGVQRKYGLGYNRAKMLVQYVSNID